jgi:A/G-specific adenine glycosylase
MKISAKQKVEFKAALQPYLKEKYRDLPWRRTKDPYKVLVSEFMLQQTQVLRVIPYYQKFINEIPNFSALFCVKSAKLLRLWQGLGYNRRALYLKRTAELIVNNYNGKLPADIPELIKLPGVGVNTAGAVMVYAFNQPSVFVETNIRKVIIKHFFSGEEKVSDVQIAQVISRVLDYKNPRAWYFAVVDYGAQLSRSRDVANSRSSHYHPQSKFEGSSRQLRAAIVRLILEKGRSTKELEGHYTKRKNKIPKILTQLEGEGFIRRQGSLWVVI